MSVSLTNNIEKVSERGEEIRDKDISDNEAEELRYLHSIYVRATPKEKQRIRERANAARLSLSRYIVQAALSERPPPDEKERAHLEEILFLFKRTSLQLRRLLAQTSALHLAGADAHLSGELLEVSSLMTRLIHALHRRL